MKVNELIFEEDDTESEQFDLQTNLNQRPEDDNFSRINSSDSRKPIVTLKHLNKLKRMKAAQNEEENNRKSLLMMMYGQTKSEE